MAFTRPIPPSFRSWIPVGERDYERPGRGTDTSGVVLELRRKNDGKPVWVQWWSKPEPGGKYTRSMFVDITDRILMEQERARLVAENVYLRTRSAKFRRQCKSNSCALAALEQTGWIFDGPHGAAKILGIHPNTLRSRMKKLGIARAPRQGQQEL